MNPIFSPIDMVLVLQRLDTNGDGKVSKKEWAAAGLPKEQFSSYDLDKDGNNVKAVASTAQLIHS